MQAHSLVVDLALVLGVAALTSPIARALGQSSVLGYLVAGLIQREGRSSALPNGRDALRDGDVLVIAGTAEAIAQARRALEVLPSAPEVVLP